MSTPAYCAGNPNYLVAKQVIADGAVAGGALSQLQVVDNSSAVSRSDQGVKPVSEKIDNTGKVRWPACGGGFRLESTRVRGRNGVALVLLPTCSLPS
jgi:hypothetical protein